MLCRRFVTATCRLRESGVVPPHSRQSLLYNLRLIILREAADLVEGEDGAFFADVYRAAVAAAAFAYAAFHAVFEAGVDGSFA